jgi:hypothetical protein
MQTIFTLFCCSVPAPANSVFLTPLQQQPPATSQPTVFFSYITPAAASSTSTTNSVIRKKIEVARTIGIISPVSP